MTQEIKTLVNKTLVFFPVRVWRRFLASNGFLLAAGVGYQALFAIFAAVYVGFTIVVLWFGAQPVILTALANIVNTVIPGLIGPNGAVSMDDLENAAAASTSVITIAGIVALVGLIWTAIGWVTFSRTAVRLVFGLEKDRRNYVILKVRDLLAAAAFGAVLLVASLMSVLSTSAIEAMSDWFGWDTDSFWITSAIRIVTLLVVFVIDALVLVVMFRFLSSAALRWRRLWGGSLLGGAALVVLQVVSSFVVGGVGGNPLLATFAVFIGLLLFFRIASIITLVADESLRKVSAQQLARERRKAELDALVLAADVRVREANEELEHAPWFSRPAAAFRLRALERDRATIIARQNEPEG
jgi:membrane protein